MKGTIVENTHGALFWVGRVYWAQAAGEPVACVELRALDGGDVVGIPFAAFASAFRRSWAPSDADECECGNPDPDDQCQACGRGRDWGDVAEARAEARLAFEADRVERMEFGGVVLREVE